MRRLVSRLAYNSKLRSSQQRRSAITKSRIQLSKLTKITLNSALTELWIGIAVEWRHADHIDIAFASKSGRQVPELMVHSVPLPQQQSSMLDSFRSTSGFEASNPGTVICDYIVDAVRFFQTRNQYKYLGAGLSQEVVRLSPSLPAQLWLELDIVPITMQLDSDSISSHWSDESSVATSRGSSCVGLV